MLKDNDQKKLESIDSDQSFDFPSYEQFKSLTAEFLLGCVITIIIIIKYIKLPQQLTTIVEAIEEIKAELKDIQDKMFYHRDRDN